MKTVLVVDDDKEIVDFISHCLGDRYQVHTAYDGLKGLRQARELKPDLLILDLMMPDMHGFEVCQTLRADEGLNAMKIMISSGKSYAVDRKAAQTIGADHYLVKPYTAEELLKAVQGLIG